MPLSTEICVGPQMTKSSPTHASPRGVYESPYMPDPVTTTATIGLSVVGDFSNYLVARRGQREPEADLAHGDSLPEEAHATAPLRGDSRSSGKD